jgi:hypothetical protein
MDVPIRCICPPGADGQPHVEDTVTLPDILDFRKTLTVRQYVSHERIGDESVPEFIVLLIEAYLLHTVAAWTLIDEAGKPLPVSKANIRGVLMADANMDVAEKVGDAADNLYSGKVFLPLMNGASSSSPGTPTTGSTSPTSGRGSTPRKHSRRSSISTSPMVVTGPMAASPAGVSS